MLIDAHVNIWHADSRLDEKYEPWPGVEPQPWWRQLLLADFAPDVQAAGVDGLVLCEADGSLAHTEFLLASARSAPLPTRVVGWLPLADPAATRAALDRYADLPELVGVRNRLEESGADPSSYATAPYATSLELLADAGMSLSMACLTAEWLATVPQVAREHPRLSIILDMMGFPKVASGRLQPWTDLISAAAAAPNVAVKAAAMYRIAGEQNRPPLWTPYTTTLLETFGPERIMLASDWPAVRNFGYSYAEAIGAAQESFADLAPAERAAIFGGTAAALHGFPDLP